MNQRIRQLAEQAEQYAYIHDGIRIPILNPEKFAELIVRECADISDASFHNGSAGYLAILKHFGIE